MLAYGILSTSFINLGISIAADRETGALRRLRGTPATASSYFIGKIMLVAIASLAEAVILLLVGVLVFRLRLPTDVFGWFTLTWVFVLGIVSCSLLGIFVSNFASNAVSAAVITNGPAVGLQFLSGTYVPLMVLPTWMLIVGSIFPVKWMAQGFRSVLLPPQMVVFEPAGSWEHWRIFLVLAAWSVVGLLACLPVFRWSDRTDRSSMPPLLSITYHFFLQIAVILLTYRLLWPLFRRLAQVQVVAIMVAGFLLGPSVLGWIWPAGAAVAVPHEADDRGRDVHPPEPRGHLRHRPTRTRALHVPGGGLVQARHPRRALRGRPVSPRPPASVSR